MDADKSQTLIYHECKNPAGVSNCAGDNNLHVPVDSQQLNNKNLYNESDDKIKPLKIILNVFLCFAVSVICIAVITFILAILSVVPIIKHILAYLAYFWFRFEYFSCFVSFSLAFGLTITVLSAINKHTKRSLSYAFFISGAIFIIIGILGIVFDIINKNIRAADIAYTLLGIGYIIVGRKNFDDYKLF